MCLSADVIMTISFCSIEPFLYGGIASVIAESGILLFCIRLCM